MECPQFKAILSAVTDDSIPEPVRRRLEDHVNSCRTCRAGMANFLKVGKILETTVYGERGGDELLRYASHAAGRQLHWETPGERERRKTAGSWRLLIKIALGFVAAAALGAGLALVLGYFGVIGEESDVRRSPALDPLPATEGPLAGPGSAPQPAADDSSFPAVVPPGGLNPDAVFDYLNDGPQQESVQAAPADSLTPADSARLRNLEAELAALRDAVARDPTNTELRRRMMDKYRRVLDERKRLRKKLRVKDYYNLGYLHYREGEYPQTVIVTTEGLRTVRMGPTRYLHYLKAMSHFRIAERASSPLPPDTTADTAARLKGAQVRAELDREGRRRAVTELRRAITEFSHLLSSPALEPHARDWILRCNEMIRELAENE